MLDRGNGATDGREDPALLFFVLARPTAVVIDDLDGHE
jgi:hypothetical protein